MSGCGAAFGELFRNQQKTWEPEDGSVGAGRQGQQSWKVEKVSPTGIGQLVVASAMFLAAAATAKHYALAPSLLRMAAALGLYTIGNLIMLRLVREYGLGVSMSLSAVLQLVAINLVAFAFFGERLMTVQAIGIAFGIASLVLILLGPHLTSR